MFLHSMTSSESAALSREAVVLVPFGACEQHGPHLPLFTDTIIAETISALLEERMPDRVLVLPSLWLGVSHHHMAFSGSMTSRAETFLRVGKEAVESMARHGFQRFLLLNAHGGNIALISTLTELLRYESNPSIRTVGVTYWHLIADEVKQIRESPLGGMGHACELETSIMLACRPELVRKDKMRKDGDSGPSHFCMKDMFAPAMVATPRMYQEITEEGGFGDPTFASAEKGNSILEAVVEKLELLISDMEAGYL